MEMRARRYGGEWPLFDLCHSMKNTKSSKKVILVDRFRNTATIEAVRLAALFPVGNFSAGFSIIDTVSIIPSHIQVDTYHLEDSRRQLQHFNQTPEWRNARPELKATFYQLAMQHQTEVIKKNHKLTPFTCNLTPEFVTKALMHKKGFHDHIKRKLDKSFKSELGRIPQYWFVVEMVPVFGGYTSGRQRPHLHGGILVTLQEKNSGRKQKTPLSKAFHKAVGYCHPDFEERILVMGNHKIYAENNNITETTAAVNWARYCFKHNALARLYLSSKSNLTADNATKRQAEALYSLLNA